MAKLIDFLIYHRLLFDVRVGRRHIRFRLIIVVVGNKIVHRVLRKYFPELIAKLGGQGFVMSDDQGWLLRFVYNVCDSKSFSASGYAQKSLMAQTIIQTRNKLFNSFRLITRRFVFRKNFKNLFRHRNI